MITPFKLSIIALLLNAPSPVVSSQSTDGEGKRTITREEIRALARVGLLDSAFALSREALSDKPNDPFLKFMAAKLNPNGKEAREAFRQVTESGDRSPETAESYFRLGQIDYAAGRYSTAIPFFRMYLNLFADGDWKDPARYWMGNACLSLARTKPEKTAYLDSALAYFQQLRIDLKPTDYYYPLAMEGLAKAQAALGDHGAAIASMQEALEKSPEEEMGAMLLLAAQLRQKEDRKEELRLMEDLLKRFPESPEARYLRRLNGGADPSKWKSGSGLIAAPANRAGAPSAEQIVDGNKPALGNAVASEGSNPSSNSDAAKPGFTLQLGAFSQKGNAEALLTTVGKLGLAPQLVESQRAGKRVYQVQIGRFSNLEAANDYATKVLKPHQLLSQPMPINP